MSDAPNLTYNNYEIANNGKYTLEVQPPKQDIHGRNTTIVKVTTNGGKTYVFEATQQTIGVKDADGNPLDKITRKELMLGKNILSEEARLEVFRYLLANKRQQTIGDGGWRGAAIVISDDGRGYIGVNTVTQKPYFKDCAEQNAVNALVSRSDTYPDSPEKVWNPNNQLPQIPRVSATYVMGGRETGTNNPTDPGTYANCPCGKCTDMLSEMMDDENPVYTLPVPHTNVLSPLSILTETDTKTINDLDPLRDQVWRTPISYLNNNRHIPLGNKAFSEAGVTALENKMNIAPKHAADLSRELSDSALNELLKTPSTIVMNIVREAGKTSLEMQDIGLNGSLARRAATAAQALENILKNRISIPELDAAAKQGEEAQFEAINHFMVEHIEDAVANRIQAAYEKNPKKYNNAKAALKDIDNVTCVVIQLSDGSFYSGMEATSALDKASPAAEVTALSSAIAKLGKESVQNVWVMEYDHHNIKQGIMETSAKEGVERILKRLKNGTSLNFHFVPFNDGSSKSAMTAQSLTQHFRPGEIFPGLFTGNNNAHASSALR